MYVAVFYFVILLFPFFFTTARCESPQVIEHWYKEVTGNRHERFLWSKISGDKIYLTSKKENENTALVCLPDGDVLLWQQEDTQGTFLTARRSGNVMSIVGRREDRDIEKEFELDERPWYQFLSFSLRSFLEDSRAEECTFWMLRPDILEPILIVATKEGLEDILLDPETIITTIKVKISPAGFKGKFWQAHYWYRCSDFLFVMYKGTHGGPLASETVMTLDLENLPPH